MAAMSAQSRRRKQATYGKTSRSANSWNSGNLDALDEDELSITAPTVSRKTSVTKSFSVQKRETTPKSKSRPKPVKKREIKQDLWDVPSSESSEDEVSPIRQQPAPRFGGKGRSEKLQETEELAPWEKAKAGIQSPKKAIRETSKLTEEDQGAQNGEHAVLLASESSPATRIGKEKIATTSSPARSSPTASSAAARLQAKRLQSGHSTLPEADKTAQPQKRTVQENNAGLGPRKRLRSNKSGDEDVLMDDASTPSCASTVISDEPDASLKDAFGRSHVQDGNSAIEAAKPKAPTAAAIQKGRRGKLTSYSSPRKMESAPARLSEMLPADTDTSDDTGSPSLTGSRPATPQNHGDVLNASSPQTAFKTSAENKQSQLLNRLLPQEATVPSPSTLAIHALNIASSRRNTGRLAAEPRALLKSSSDVGRPRMRLVDRLKASAQSSDGESSEEDGSDSSDVEMVDAGERDAAMSQQSQTQSQQSQSQSTAANGRPKVTYAAAQISWLKEESLEDELMLTMPSESLQRSVAPASHAFARQNSASQKSGFEFDDSDDDEGGSRRLRSIHELRAGGINQRFMDDIHGLLEDVSNHNLSARSRRRSAMIDIATKLGDKAFAAKFYRQGFEQQLMAECIASPDDVADYALATAIVVLMTGDPPEHAAQSLSDGGAIALLVRMLGQRTDPRKLAKERRNNMSKGAQSDFSRFVTYVTEQQGIWEGLKPSLVTSRTIALKALDLLVGRLRRSGDRSETVSSHEVQEVLSSQDDVDAIRDGEITADLTLAVSVLESLSTTTTSLSWPVELTDCLRAILTSQPRVSEDSQHLRFLTLRLCLNLTNGNQKNCRAFAKMDIVITLLRSMADGFETLFQDQEASQRTISLDLLVLSMGIMINLTEQKTSACEYAAMEEAAPLLATLVAVFLKGQQRTIEAESVEDGVTNVAFGYLAVVLANICRNRDARRIVSSKLPGEKLTTLVEAVHEFVVHHQKVDALNFEGEEGTAVWSAFTEKLKGVLSRLRAEAEVDEIDAR